MILEPGLARWVESRSSEIESDKTENVTKNQVYKIPLQILATTHVSNSVPSIQIHVTSRGVGQENTHRFKFSQIYVTSYVTSKRRMSYHFSSLHVTTQICWWENEHTSHFFRELNLEVKN